MDERCRVRRGEITRAPVKDRAGRPHHCPLVTATPIHNEVFVQWRMNSHCGEAALAWSAELCGNPYHAMQAILRKYSPGLMTAAIYTGILLFALLCTFAGS